MSLIFDRVDEIFKSEFGLLSKTRERNDNILYSYYFEDRYLNTRKSEVAREITELKGGGVGGYIYVGHLQEYNEHSKRHKDGYLNIGHMKEHEFIDLVTQVVKNYK